VLSVVPPYSPLIPESKKTSSFIVGPKGDCRDNIVMGVVVSINPVDVKLSKLDGCPCPKCAT
jgi:hypothetical protein